MQAARLLGDGWLPRIRCSEQEFHSGSLVTLRKFLSPSHTSQLPGLSLVVKWQMLTYAFGMSICRCRARCALGLGHRPNARQIACWRVRLGILSHIVYIGVFSVVHGDPIDSNMLIHTQSGVDGTDANGAAAAAVQLTKWCLSTRTCRSSRATQRSEPQICARSKKRCCTSTPMQSIWCVGCLMATARNFAVLLQFMALIDAYRQSGTATLDAQAVLDHLDIAWLAQLINPAAESSPRAHASAPVVPPSPLQPAQLHPDVSNNPRMARFVTAVPCAGCC